MQARRITSAAVPEAPAATFANAWLVGSELILSGQIAAPAAPEGALEQTRVVLGKIAALLEAAGGGIHNILKLTVYLTDIADREAVAQARREFFGAGPYPASTLVAVKALVLPELKVEIDAVARLDVDLRQASSTP